MVFKMSISVFLIGVIVLTCSINTVTSVDTTGCGVTKGCYMDPVGCTTSCDALITWQPSDTGDTTDFGILGKLKNGEDYMVFALSHDTRMGDDDVWGCLMLQDSSIVLDHSLNIGQQNSQGDTTGTSGFSSSYSNGVLECSFTRDNSMPGSEDRFYDLTTSSYYLLIGFGPRISISDIHVLGEHIDIPVASKSKIDLTQTTIVSAGTRNPGKKIHGLFMMLGWVICASSALILARYYKPMWPNTKIFGKPIWFQVHRALMVSATICTCAGFIAIFITVGGWVTSILENVHAVIGIIVTALALINPIMALFRPGPGTPNRVIFNWAHWSVGTSGHILAVVDIAIGIDLLGMPDYCLWVFIVWIVFHFSVQICLELVNCVNREFDGFLSYKMYSKLSTPRQSDNPDSSHPDGMKISEPGLNPDEKPRPPASRGRTFLFVLYTTITVAIIMFLIIQMFLL
ncbi:ferric-chelate reductase 1-like [Saccoglossus kowalevskii]|uniref:Ferric-chelate reductase 1-like n=1 Tax=Saccoglossus kowalevskii TaxID=10224 RepID=A0ABM0GK85_SACKO|nr:PREDICTED: ferric-chelate reductase 1-like [Saccoglossus kowalevskii]